jgi:DNA invertase Pin-like site-specific DNA recombinase
MVRSSATPKPAHAGSTRCAIYTRKSSEDGLEQAFNSLHAQREACLAYISSQRHEGWRALSTHYDDGGFSGGTLNRPAVQQLLADIRAGRVDLVVIYKVDRLTRSLADFAKLVETFDAHGVSFVSITQHFNTTTSIGRLTLNMLLSFAQFEREVTGERIRDKIAASKRRGMWMGGPPALGYDVRDRKLVINEAEAATVRHIFRSYRDLGSVRLLQQRLRDEDIRSKLHRTASDSVRGRQTALPRCPVSYAAEPAVSWGDQPQRRDLSGRAARHRRRGIVGCGAEATDRASDKRLRRTEGNDAEPSGGAAL